MADPTTTITMTPVSKVTGGSDYGRTLPVELLLQIFGLIDHQQDLNSLTRVNRLFHGLATPFLYQVATLEIVQDKGIKTKTSRPLIFRYPANPNLQHIRKVVIYGKWETSSTLNEYGRAKNGADWKQLALDLRNNVWELTKLQINSFMMRLEADSVRKYVYGCKFHVYLDEETEDHLRHTQTKLRSIKIDYGGSCPDRPSWYLNFNGPRRFIDAINFHNVVDELSWLQALALMVENKDCLRKLGISLGYTFSSRVRSFNGWARYAGARPHSKWHDYFQDIIHKAAAMSFPNLESLQLFNFEDSLSVFSVEPVEFLGLFDHSKLRSLKLSRCDALQSWILNNSTGMCNLSVLSTQLNEDMLDQGNRWIESLVQLEELRLHIYTIEGFRYPKVENLKHLKRLFIATSEVQNDGFRQIDEEQVRVLRKISQLEEFGGCVNLEIPDFEADDFPRVRFLYLFQTPTVRDDGAGDLAFGETDGSGSEHSGSSSGDEYPYHRPQRIARGAARRASSSRNSSTDGIGSNSSTSPPSPSISDNEDGDEDDEEILERIHYHTSARRPQVMPEIPQPRYVGYLGRDRSPPSLSRRTFPPMLQLVGTAPSSNLSAWSFKPRDIRRVVRQESEADDGTVTLEPISFDDAMYWFPRSKIFRLAQKGCSPI